LLAAAGWKPKWESETSVNRVLQSLAEKSLDGIKRVRLSGEQVTASRRAVWLFWEQHLGRIPRTRKFLEETIHG